MSIDHAARGGQLAELELEEAIRTLSPFAYRPGQGLQMRNEAIASEAARTGLSEIQVRQVWERGCDVDTVLDAVRRLQAARAERTERGAMKRTFARRTAGLGKRVEITRGPAKAPPAGSGPPREVMLPENDIPDAAADRPARRVRNSNKGGKTRANLILEA